MSNHRRRCRRLTAKSAIGGLLLAATVASPALAGPTEDFAKNVLIKNYTFGDDARTSILDDTLWASCRVLRKKTPTATCTLGWSSDHASWTARARFTGATRTGGKRYKKFRWRFDVTETCVGDACAQLPADQQVRRHVWKGRGYNTPA